MNYLLRDLINSIIYDLICSESYIEDILNGKYEYSDYVPEPNRDNSKVKLSSECIDYLRKAFNSVMNTIDFLNKAIS